MEIDRDRIKSTIGKCTAFTHRPPRIPQSDRVTDGPLLGNGDIGVSIAGNPELLTWYIGKNDFWVQAHVGETWEQRISRLTSHKGDRERRTGTRPIPVGYIDLEVPEMNGARYRMEQDILNAEVRGSFDKFAPGSSLLTNSWTCAVENLIVIELQSGDAGIPEIRLIPHAGERGQYERFAYADCIEDDLIWIRYSANLQNIPGRRSVGMAVRVLGVPTVQRDGLFNKALCFSLEKNQTAYAVIPLLSDLDSPEYLETAIDRAKTITVDDIEKLKSQHREWWMDFWSASFVEFGDELLEQYYYGSQYILACCTREGKVMPGLYGNWVTIDRPKWTGSYTMNYNYQSPFWALFTANHGSITRGYCDTLLEIIPIGKEYAKTKLHCRGIYLPVELGPWGTVCSTLFHGQKSNAVYGAVNMILDFNYSWDLEYARKIYQYLIEVAEFWEDYLTLEDGRYVIEHDALGEQYDGSTDRNPIITIALLKFLLKGIISISTELQVDDKRRLTWQDILERLSGYTTFSKNGKTVFRLTESGTEWREKRGFAALAPIYPSGDVGLGSEPELLQVAYDTFVEQDTWDDFNAFQCYYAAGARVGYDPTELLRQLRGQCSTRGFPNLQIFHGGGGIEECNGIPACINEMMLQSHDFTLRIFPNWERDRDAVFINLRAYGAFLVSGKFSDGKVQCVVIESERGRDLRVANPWKSGSMTVVKHGEVYKTADSECLSLETEPGDVVILVPGGADYNERLATLPGHISS